MDYCHPCHRHLNGALACPGCGTPAEACREYAEAVAEQEAPAGSERTYDDVVPRSRGRRRERGRRAHRRRRRKVLLITAGLALAAGGLSLAELGIEGPSEEPTAAASPDGGAARPASRTPQDPVDGTATGAESAAATSAGPSASKSAKDKAAKEAKKDEDKKKAGEKTQGADEDPDPAAPVTTSAPDTPDSPPDAPATTRPTPPPTTQQPDPTPEPEPSQTCDRFLWWCT
ncbi:SCO2400 family protein [Streptomyces sp. NPDC054864]